LNYLYSNNLSALDYMLLDSYLTREFSEDFFRLYFWRNPTISLGFTNNLEDLDEIQFDKSNCDIVMRETGGGIVYHDGDLCFSFIQNSILSPIENYNFLKNHLESFLSNLGFNITSTLNENYNANICFEGKNKHEISIDGKKVIGMSQRKINNRYLIQGSIQLKTTLFGRIKQEGLNCNQSVLDSLYNHLDTIFSFRDLDVTGVLDKKYLKYKQRNVDRFYVE